MKQGPHKKIVLLLYKDDILLVNYEYMWLGLPASATEHKHGKVFIPTSWSYQAIVPHWWESASLFAIALLIRCYWEAFDQLIMISYLVTKCNLLYTCRDYYLLFIIYISYEAKTCLKTSRVHVGLVSDMPKIYYLCSLLNPLGICLDKLRHI